MKTIIATMLLLAPIPATAQGLLGSGYARGGSTGDFHYDTYASAGAYRVPGGIVIPGSAQNPGCGGGSGQYPCPLPRYIPDPRHDCE